MGKRPYLDLAVPEVSCGIKTFPPVPGQASSVVGTRSSFQQGRALSVQGVASRAPHSGVLECWDGFLHCDVLVYHH